MYLPRHFANNDRESLFAMIDATAVGLLITNGPGGVQANTVPFLRQPGADRLWGHLAGNNPQLSDLEAAGEALVVFSGPHGYVSPNWYADPQQVPTWNFVSVQVRGPAVLHPDTEEIQDILERLTARHEADFPAPWTMDKMDADRRLRMLRAVVGFHIDMIDVQGKFKLSQNRSAEDRATVAAGLAQRGCTELAALMRQQEEA